MFYLSLTFTPDFFFNFIHGVSMPVQFFFPFVDFFPFFLSSLLSLLSRYICIFVGALYVFISERLYVWLRVCVRIQACFPFLPTLSPSPFHSLPSSHSPHLLFIRCPLCRLQPPSGPNKRSECLKDLSAKEIWVPLQGTIITSMAGGLGGHHRGRYDAARRAVGFDR